MTPEEAVDIGARIEAIAKKEAEKAQEEGRKRGGGDRKSDEANRSGKTFPKAIRDEAARTTAVAAKAVGMSRPTYTGASHGLRQIW